MARRTRMTFDVIEDGDNITLHFEGDRFPPLWFSKRHRPAGYAKLRAVLDELEIVEDVPASAIAAPGGVGQTAA